MMKTDKHRYSITIIGSGNVAWHLGVALKLKGVLVKQVISRNEKEGSELAKALQASYYSNFEEFDHSADAALIAVKDSAIEQVVEQMPDSKVLIAHTSGSIPVDVVSNRFKNSGVFYPLQTFSKKVKTGKLNYPVCIEGNHSNSLHKLKDIAELLTNEVTELDSEQRKKVHFSAVIANNFTNHLLTRAFDFLEENHIPRDLLSPILQETVRKAISEGPQGAQTGPAMRGDSEVMKKHVALLKHFPELCDIYNVMSASIRAYYSDDLK